MNQNKKYISLSEINNNFTEKVLINILSKIYSGKEVRLTDWTINEGSTKGDNYLSNVYKSKVNGIIDGNPKQVNIIIKSMPKNPATRKTLRCADFFFNEIAFYTQIVPKFEKFLTEKGQSDLLCIPRHIISSADSENGFLVLEDVSSSGFHTVMRQKSLDWEEFSAALKTLSNFHAISFAYKDQKREDFTEMKDSLKETFFSSEYWDWYKGFHEKMRTVIEHAITTEYPDSEAEKRYKSYQLSAPFNKCTELCKKKDASTSVILQGDCWTPNFLFRDVGQNKKQALMLDFQLARCASPILDLSLLIYSCTSGSFRDQYFDKILKLYHSQLSDTIKSLESDPEKIYPWDLFMKEVKEQFAFGAFASIDAIPVCLMDVSESFTIDTAIQGDEAINISDAIDFPYITTASGRQRVADVIVHAMKKGYI